MPRQASTNSESTVALGFEYDFSPEHADTFRADLPPDLKSDFILTNF